MAMKGVVHGEAQPTRVCVTGAAGFIGANLVARLKAQGDWVRAVDMKAAPHRAWLYEQADEVWKHCDLRIDGEAIDALYDCDRVFHLAADHGGAGYFHSDADLGAALNNLRIDQNVLAAALEHRPERLFFASSACAYPVGIQGPNAEPLREREIGRGDGEQLYGNAKRMTMMLMEGARDRLDARSGVFHTIYGPGQDYREPRAKFPTALCRKLIENPDRVEVWGDGTQVRTFLFIDDALDRIQQVMADEYAGPVNIGSDEAVTIRQCCQWAAEAAGVAPEWVWVDGPTGVLHRAADNSEWNRRYGATPLTSARDGFARTYGWLASEIERR